MPAAAGDEYNDDDDNNNSVGDAIPDPVNMNERDEDSVGDAVTDLNDHRHRLVHLHLPSTALGGHMERRNCGKTTEGVDRDGKEDTRLNQTELKMLKNVRIT